MTDCPGFVATERVLTSPELAFVADKAITSGVVGRVVASFAMTGQHKFDNGTSHAVPTPACELGSLP